MNVSPKPEVVGALYEPHSLEIEDVLPLSPLQEGFLFHALYDESGPDSYLVQTVFNLPGRLDGSALQAAAAGLLKRHANLRAGFVQQGLSGAVQVIPREVNLPWQEHDLSAWPEGEREGQVERIVKADQACRFDPARAPLIRFMLIGLSAQEHRLVVTNHHILLDGWSSPIFYQELFTLYKTRGDAGSLPRVTAYRDYLVWLKKQDRAQSQQVWREALAGLEEPTRVAPGKSTDFVITQTITRVLSEELTESLTRVSRRHGLTLNTLVQGAWGILLGQLTGQTDVVFGITVSGRPPELAGSEHMVGLLINTVPLRLQMGREETLLAMLTRLQEQQAMLMAHQYLGLTEIQRLAGLGELFDTSVVFENYPVDEKVGAASGGELRVGFAGNHGGDTTHYPLSLAAMPGRGLRLCLGYRPDVFDQATVERLAGRLVRVFEAMAGDPGQRVGQIDLLDPAERRQIVVDWNATAQPIPEATLPELFEAQVKRSPEAVAVIFEETQLTYAELNTRANQLAHYLIQQGVGPESLVAIALPRSLEMIVALLGILKAGAAYLPLDPDYPAERLAFMLQDAKPGCLISLEEWAPELPEHTTKLCLDDPAMAETLAARPTSNPGDSDRRQPVWGRGPCTCIAHSHYFGAH